MNRKKAVELSGLDLGRTITVTDFKGATRTGKLISVSHELASNLVTTWLEGTGSMAHNPLAPDSVVDLAGATPDDELFARVYGSGALDPVEAQWAAAVERIANGNEANAEAARQQMFGQDA